MLKPREIISGVYYIRNTINGKVYVGSAGNVRLRWIHHRNRLRRHEHHSRHLQAAWNLYGPDVFEFRLLEAVMDETQLHVREDAWVQSLKSNQGDYGYNLRVIAKSNRGYTLRTPRKPSGGGWTHDEVARANMSVAAKARVTPKTVAHLQTPEVRAKMVEAKKGKPPARWITEKGIAASLGRIKSPEERAKLSAALKGKTQSLTVRLAVAESNRRRAKYKTQEEKRAARRAVKQRYLARRRASNKQGELGLV